MRSDYVRYKESASSNTLNAIDSPIVQLSASSLSAFSLAFTSTFHNNFCTTRFYTESNSTSTLLKYNVKLRQICRPEKQTQSHADSAESNPTQASGVT